MAPAHGLHGQEGYIKVPLFQQQNKRKNAVTKKSKTPKKRTEKQQISVSVNAFAIGGTFEVRSHSTLLLIGNRDFKGSGA